MKFLLFPVVPVVLSISSCAPAKREQPDLWKPQMIPKTRKSVAGIVVGELPAGMRPPGTVSHLDAHQTLWKMGGLSLKLDLGDRKPVGTSSAYRTDSRYTLVDGNGASLASAESTLATQDLNDDQSGEITVLEDATSKTLLIAEEQSWSVQRYIILRPADGLNEAGNPSSGRWNVRYFRMPIRETGAGQPDPPKLLGIKGSKLYVKQNNQYYALPLEELETEPSLEYTIG